MTVETLLFGIAILIVLAKVFGEIAERFGFSALIGEVIAGIVLGPSLLKIVYPSVALGAIAEIGILFLMFIFGLSAKFEESMGDNAYQAALIAVLGGALSFFFCFIAGISLGYSTIVAITIGAALTSTALGITVRALTEIGQFYGKVTRALIASNVADDIFAIIVMSLFLSFVQFGSISILDSWKVFLIVIGFFIIVLKFGSLIAEKIMDFTVKLKDQESMIAIPIVLMFAIALLSEQVKIASITGAFLAGIILAKTKYSETTIMPKAKTIGYGFIIPLFFAYVGLNVDLFSLKPEWLLLIFVVIAAIAGKLIGVYVGARLSGYSTTESKKMGWGMIPRAEYTMVIAQLALIAGVITIGIHSVLVMVVVITTIITPILIRYIYENY